MDFFRRERRTLQIKENVKGFVYPKLKVGVEKKVEIQRNTNKVLWIKKSQKSVSERVK